MLLDTGRLVTLIGRLLVVVMSEGATVEIGEVPVLLGEVVDVVGWVVDGGIAKDGPELDGL